MKRRRYNGRTMTIYGSVLPGAASIARFAYRVDQITTAARRRIKILDWHRAHEKNISLTARHFGLRRATVREWKKRFDQNGILGLVDGSRRPKRTRRPTTSREIESRVVALRKQYPAWSKHKIRVLLKREGVITSVSTVGRVLKRRGLIDKKISRKRRKAAISPRARFPHGFKISAPGDMVQMDTKHVTLLGGRKIYQFTAIDVLTKQRILRYYPSLASKNGAAFLEECIRSFLFIIRAIQTDNGPEFLKEFDRLCKAKNLPHYFIYPRTPKQNTYVENSHGSDKREFYQQGALSTDIPIMHARLKERERVWNTVRPHEAIGQLTPYEYFERWQQGRLPTKDVITLQT
jgi:transposase InsO family protein